MLDDMTLEDLWEYKPKKTMEPDFEEFWEKTKQISVSEPLHEEMIKINYIIDEIEAYKVYYDGFGGARIRGFCNRHTGSDG